MLDNLNLKILGELENRGIGEVRTIAANLGVAQSTIYRRIRSMINKGIIKIDVIPNPMLLGYEAIADIGIRVQHRSPEEAARELASHRSTYSVFLVSGIFDIMTEVRFNSLSILAKYVDTVVNEIEGIRERETILYIRPRKYYSFLWPAPSLSDDRMVALSGISTRHESTFKIDDIDRNVLKILSQDAMTSLVKIKTKLGISESTVWKHLQNMREKDVFRTDVVINPVTLPEEVWVEVFIHTSHRRIHDVIDDVLRYHEVKFASEALGRFNIVILSRFHSKKSFDRFIKSELPAIEGIERFEYALVYKLIKHRGINWAQDSNKS
jgi:Lrp/AsnC family transcriptional regulator, regulator for asnA, asnC and gidA